MNIDATVSFVKILSHGKILSGAGAVPLSDAGCAPLADSGVMSMALIVAHCACGCAASELVCASFMKTFGKWLTRLCVLMLGFPIIKGYCEGISRTLVENETFLSLV